MAVIKIIGIAVLALVVVFSVLAAVASCMLASMISQAEEQHELERLRVEQAASDQTSIEV
jgi:uncharacterized membrane protein